MPSRREATQIEKGEHLSYFTLGEFASYMGVSQDTLKRWVRFGKCPPARVRSAHGWRLWHPEDVRSTLQKRLRGEI